MTRNSKFPLKAWPRRQTSPYNEGGFTVGDCQGKASRVRALVGILLLLSTGAVALAGIREAGAAPAMHPASGQADRDSWQQPEKVMDAVGIRPGMTVGEVGAGSGYFTFKLSRRVGAEGKIYANDIDRQALEGIEKRAKREEIANIITVLGEVERPLFPEAAMDLVIMVYVLHDLTKPVELLENVRPSLRVSAPLVILERDPEKMSGAAGHFYSKEKLLGIVEKAGYEVSRIETFLSRDTIYVCLAKKETAMPDKIKHIEAKVISVKGTCGLGHKPGDIVRFTEQGVEGKVCIHALYSMLPAVFAMMFEARFPWLQDPDKKTHACPDAAFPVVFEISRVRES